MAGLTRISVLGSTGSIGSHTLEIVDQFPDRFEVVALAAGKNLDKLFEQVRRYRPRFVSVATEEGAARLREAFPGLAVEPGAKGLETAAGLPEADAVVVGIVGFAALSPTLEAVRRGKRVALANKEALIAAGPLLRAEIAKHPCRCIPVDSEHNALYQLLEGRDPGHVRSLVLTASGGPLFRRPELKLTEVTPEVAIAHPNWSMGPKISVDSATLMNKGLELIEAHVLFDFPEDRIEVWVHPQSIVHGAIWLEDNTCLAQLSRPNMKSSIGHALGAPDRLPEVIPKLSLVEMAKLEFFPPDDQRFPALKLARQALRAGPSHVIALNALNEMAVHAFLSRRIRFDEIPVRIDAGLALHAALPIGALEDVFHADESARAIGQALGLGGNEAI